MRKTFKLDELDCANCGAKMEAAIKKIDGVVDAKITFMTQSSSSRPTMRASTKSWTKRRLFVEKSNPIVKSCVKSQAG